MRNLMKEKIPGKLFFSIGEVSKLTDVPSYVLRYWESEFSQLKPEKGRTGQTGQRKYRKKDIETILKIKELLYGKLYTIAGAKNELNKEAKGKKKSNSFDLQYLKKELQEILEILS